jgi:hypothetical protein
VVDIQPHNVAEKGKNVPEALVEMELKSHAVLTQVFEPGRIVLHIYLVGRDHDCNKSYLRSDIRAKDVLRRVIEMATYHGLALYLEATSPRSRTIFQDLGFCVAREVKLGVGIVDERGRQSQTGCGVSLWIATFKPGTR